MQTPQVDAKDKTKPEDANKKEAEENQVDPEDIEYDIVKKPEDPEDIEFDIVKKPEEENKIEAEEGEGGEGEESYEEVDEDEEELEERIVYKNEHLADLNEDGKKRVYALKSIQKLKNNIMLKYKEELEELDRKYDNILQPNYRERDEIAYKELPYFWYYAMRNNPVIVDSTNLCEADKPIFKFLKRVFCTPFPREMCQVPGTDNFVCKLGFDVIFEFAEGNPFFEESVLIKSYYLIEDDPGEYPVFDFAESTEITWKEDYKENNGSFNFFLNFFKSSQLPLDSDPQEEIEELTEIIQRDFEVGRELRESVCPNAYLWYTGDVKTNLSERLDAEDFKDDDNDDEEKKEDQKENDNENEKDNNQEKKDVKEKDEVVVEEEQNSKNEDEKEKKEEKKEEKTSESETNEENKEELKEEK